MQKSQVWIQAHFRTADGYEGTPGGGNREQLREMSKVRKVRSIQQGRLFFPRLDSVFLQADVEIQFVNSVILSFFFPVEFV